MTVPVRAGVDLRLLRAAVFSAVCVMLSAIGHAWASGAGISFWALLAGWAGVLCVVAPLAGRERSLPGIAVTLLGGELGLHLLFSLGQSSTTAARGGSTTVAALAERLLCDAQLAHLTPQRAAQVVRQAGIGSARAMGGAPGMTGMSSASGMVTHGAHSMGAMPLASMFTPSMLAAHLTAALVVGWLLRRGEAALWQAVRLYAVVAERLAVVVPLTALFAAFRVLALVADLIERRLTALRRNLTRTAAAQRPSFVLQHCVIRRGPPGAAVAA